MNKSTPEYIRVREEIAKKYCGHNSKIGMILADRILAIKGIAIIADDQNLPINTENDICNTSPKRVCDDTMKTMIETNFKKVVE